MYGVQPGVLGGLLRRFRLAAGFSQEQLAERAGLSVDAVAALERGRRTTPRPSTLALLAKALGLTPTERDFLLSAAAQSRAAGTRRASRSSSEAAQLPVPATSLVGREQETAAVSNLLKQDGGLGRLVTLTGPSGVGKTRLALTVAAAAQTSFPDGVFFVDLAPVRDHRLVAATMARALGIRESNGSTRDLLLTHLRPRELLLVLDGFEYLLDAGALLARFAAACPLLALLITSRAPLGLPVEQSVRVLPLTAGPDAPSTASGVAEYEAAQLFLERAQAVAPRFALGDANAEAVAEVCRRLDGLPLAIELAAARVTLLPPAAMLERLQKPLSLLDLAAREVPDFDQTLRATIDWSYRLLGEPERAVFRRLAAFAAGGTLEAAEAVCRSEDVASVVEALTRLTDANLVWRQPGPDGVPRLRMHDTVAAYAEEQLAASGEADAVQRRHAVYFLGIAEAAEPELVGRHPSLWLRRLGLEYDNLRLALIRLLDWGEVELAQRLAAAAGRGWQSLGQVVAGRDWLDRLLARESGLARRGIRRQLPTANAAAAATHAHSARPRLLPTDAAVSLRQLGFMALLTFDDAFSRSCLEDALAIADDAGFSRVAALSLERLGWLDYRAGNLLVAQARLAEALARWNDLDELDASSAASARAGLGHVAAKQGDLADASAHFTHIVCDPRQTPGSASVQLALEGFAHIAVLSGESRRATLLAGAASALGEVSGATRTRWADPNTDWPGGGRAGLTQQEAEEAWHAGRALAPADALALALVPAPDIAKPA
ncbi:MAG: helix-turn-helix domain-containing protein [Chloroflexi bacterium]|nr:MAG: helix-turn-helix domain-containing protein [Chloroflexota bacterium]